MDESLQKHLASPEMPSPAPVVQPKVAEAPALGEPGAELGVKTPEAKAGPESLSAVESLKSRNGGTWNRLADGTRKFLGGLYERIKSSEMAQNALDRLAIWEADINSHLTGERLTRLESRLTSAETKATVKTERAEKVSSDVANLESKMQELGIQLSEKTLEDLRKQQGKATEQKAKADARVEARNERVKAVKEEVEGWEKVASNARDRIDGRLGAKQELNNTEIKSLEGLNADSASKLLENRAALAKIEAHLLALAGAKTETSGATARGYKEAIKKLEFQRDALRLVGAGYEEMVTQNKARITELSEKNNKLEAKKLGTKKAVEAPLGPSGERVGQTADQENEPEKSVQTEAPREEKSDEYPKFEGEIKIEDSPEILAKKFEEQVRIHLARRLKVDLNSFVVLPEQSRFVGDQNQGLEINVKASDGKVYGVRGWLNDRHTRLEGLSHKPLASSESPAPTEAVSQAEESRGEEKRAPVEALEQNAENSPEALAKKFENQLKNYLSGVLNISPQEVSLENGDPKERPQLSKRSPDTLVVIMKTSQGERYRVTGKVSPERLRDLKNRKLK